MIKNVLVIILAITFSGCAVNEHGQLGTDGRVFNKKTIMPLGAGLISAVICNQLFDGHGSRDGWTAVCGAAGYFASTAFLNQHSRALEDNKIGQTTGWSDPDGGAHSVTPTKTYYDGKTPCREFRQTVEIDGQTEIMAGKACRQNDGTWRLVS